MFKKRILVTGGAGFIGFTLSRELLNKDVELIVLDNFSDYYDPNLKRSRHQVLLNESKLTPLIPLMTSNC